jgi:histidinol dehydrogenase
VSARLFSVESAIRDLTPDARAAMRTREFGRDGTIRDSVASIISRVRDRGDTALRELARELDGVELSAIEVPRQACNRALDRLDRNVVRALERARDNIARAHAAWKPACVEVETEPGVVIGRRPDPLGRVGVYAPGGRAAYPSSVLMGVVPARVAGVSEVILCSPPHEAGLPAGEVLAAATLAEVDRVFALGGAGAIAAMAFGTETVPAVNRIVGPGNAYVAEAKAQVAARVAIDSPAGPSELVVIWDASVQPDTIAREVVAQAEHDPDAAIVVIALPGASREELCARLTSQLSATPRGTIAREALACRGALLWAEESNEALQFANDWAPEHLLLAVEDPEVMLPSVRSAGTVFLGEQASVVFGDYMTGANHVLPTGGAARGYSGLSTHDFVRWTTYQRIDRQAAARMAADVGVLADAEGLPAHAAAARAWGAGANV